MMAHKICFSEEIWIIIHKLSLLLLLIWSPNYGYRVLLPRYKLIGWFEYSSLLKQYFSPYWAISKREGVIDERKKQSPNSPHLQAQQALALLLSKLEDAPALEVNPASLHHVTTSKVTSLCAGGCWSASY